MVKATATTSPQVCARVAGLRYLMVVPLGFFGNYGHANLILLAGIYH